MLLRFWDPIDQCCTFVLIVGPSVNVTETEQSRAGGDAGGLRDASGSAGIGQIIQNYETYRGPIHKKKAFTHKEEGNRFVLKMS